MRAPGGARKGITSRLAGIRRQRSAIGPEICQMKSEGSAQGRERRRAAAPAAHDIRKILARLRAFWISLIAAILGALRPDNRQETVAAAA